MEQYTVSFSGYTIVEADSPEMARIYVEAMLQELATDYDIEEVTE